MKPALGSLCLLVSLVLTSCASAADVVSADGSPTQTDETTESTPTASTLTETGPTQTAPSPTETTETTAAPPTETTPTKTKPTKRQPALAKRPEVGNCYDTTTRQFRAQRDGSSPISCNRRHTAETFAVFSVSPYPRGREIDRVWRACNLRFAQYVGDAATLSKLDLALMLPSNDQVTDGQGWIRCDAIVKRSYNSRVGEPRSGSLEGALGDGVPRQFRGCVKRWPKVDQAVRFTSCDQFHQAELIPDSLFLGPPEGKYPGVTSVTARSKSFCRSIFQEYVPETDRFYFYFPTRASWKSGSHNTTCWALDITGDRLPPL